MIRNCDCRESEDGCEDEYCLLSKAVPISFIVRVDSLGNIIDEYIPFENFDVRRFDFVRLINYGEFSKERNFGQIEEIKFVSSQVYSMSFNKNRNELVLASLNIPRVVINDEEGLWIIYPFLLNTISVLNIESKSMFIPEELKNFSVIDSGYSNINRYFYDERLISISKFTNDGFIRCSDERMTIFDTEYKVVYFFKFVVNFAEYRTTEKYFLITEAVDKYDKFTCLSIDLYSAAFITITKVNGKENNFDILSMPVLTDDGVLFAPVYINGEGYFICRAYINLDDIASPYDPKRYSEVELDMKTIYKISEMLRDPLLYINYKNDLLSAHINICNEDDCSGYGAPLFNMMDDRHYTHYPEQFAKSKITLIRGASYGKAK
jgi:hypothetical protein